MKIFDATLGTLERALDARLLRHNVLAGNLANSDTPGYIPRDVDFAAAMREQVRDDGGAPPVPRAGITLASAGHAVAGAGDIPLAAAGALDASGAIGAPGSPGSPVIAVKGAGAGLDGNAVDVDRALAAVAENAIQYNAAARAVQKKLAILRYVASDGAA